MTYRLAVYCTAIASCLAVLTSTAHSTPSNFLFSGPGKTQDLLPLLKRPDIDGMQIVYNWRMLEPEKGVYDFSMIEEDYKALKTLDKKLFVQLQDRFFATENRNLPDYLLQDPEYRGGLVPQIDNPGENLPKQQGWAAVQWNDPLRNRFQALLTALADRFDGEIFGINLPESALDIDQEQDKTGFTCTGYADATLENMSHARHVFEHSHVVQYVNFWPCEWNNDQGYMARAFETADKLGIGLGGPDIIPHRRAHEKNAYPFFHRYNSRLSLVAMAVQPPTLTYTNPKTGNRFTKEEIISYAEDYLGVDIIFWTPRAPWLRDTAGD